MGNGYTDISIEEFIEVFGFANVAAQQETEKRRVVREHRPVECIGLAPGVGYKYQDDIFGKIGRGEVLHAVAKF